MNLDLSPAHLHCGLNHIPILGIAFSAFPIFVGLLTRSRITLAVGLLSILICAAFMPLILQTGGEAADALTSGKILPPLDKAGQEALDVHGARADITTPVIYASALLAFLALIALMKFPKAATWLSSAVLLGALISVALSVWTAEAGGKIRHIEFRSPGETPPIKEEASLLNTSAKEEKSSSNQNSESQAPLLPGPVEKSSS